MSHEKIQNKKTKTVHSSAVTSESKESFADVLYQRIGGKWYAFSIVNDEVYLGEVDPENYTPSEKDQKIPNA